MKRIFLLFMLCVIYVSVTFSATPRKTTRTYAQKDGIELKMDIYRNAASSDVVQPCLVFVFGGGFKEGTRDAQLYLPYFNYFAEKGFTVVSIDYRLGMKGEKSPSIFNQKPLRNSISMAVNDLFSATEYLLKHADELHIDTEKIIISGSSAGAITVLQADYERSNRFISAQILPETFRYAGVISFAGAIYSNQGSPKYKTNPAPTLFFHGDADKLVPFKSVRFFNIGMFGSRAIVAQFRNYGFPFTFYSMKKNGHNVSEYPMKDFLSEIDYFIQHFVCEKKQWQIEIDFYDKNRVSDITANPANYYN